MCCPSVRQICLNTLSELCLLQFEIFLSGILFVHDKPLSGATQLTIHECFSVRNVRTQVVAVLVVLPQLAAYTQPL